MSLIEGLVLVMVITIAQAVLFGFAVKQGNKTVDCAITLATNSLTVLRQSVVSNNEAVKELVKMTSPFAAPQASRPEGAYVSEEGLTTVQAVMEGHPAFRGVGGDEEEWAIEQMAQGRSLPEVIAHLRTGSFGTAESPAPDSIPETEE